MVKNDSRLAFLHELIPEMVSVQAALEAQRSRSISQSLATAASTSNTQSPASTPSKAGSSESVNMDASKANRSIADFFAKKPTNQVDIEDMQWIVNA